MRILINLFLAIFIKTRLCRTLQFYIEPVQRTNPTYVQQLIEGNIKRVEHGMNLTSSISLVYDGGHYIIVDSPSATDVHSKEKMLRGVASRNVSPGEIQYVVTTHGHPDHFGQGNFFPNARHFFGSYEYSDTNFISTELHTKDVMQLTQNVQLWNTPGHTAQDLSVIVHNVSCCGVVAVVGDLFYHEDDAHEINGVWFQEAWNPIIGKISRNKVICYANYIIPGHGKLFKVTQEMRKDADCFAKYETSSVKAEKSETIPETINQFGTPFAERKPAETLFSNSIQTVQLAQSLQSDRTFQSAQTLNNPKVDSNVELSTENLETTTNQIYTVDLAEETPSTKVMENYLFDIQQNLPPLGSKIKKNVNYIELPDNIHPMVEDIAKKVSSVMRNETEIEKIAPDFKKWKTTLSKLSKLWQQYFHAN